MFICEIRHWINVYQIQNYDSLNLCGLKVCVLQEVTFCWHGLGPLVPQEGSTVMVQTVFFIGRSSSGFPKTTVHKGSLNWLMVFKKYSTHILWCLQTLDFKLTPMTDFGQACWTILVLLIINIIEKHCVKPCSTFI